MLSIRRRLRLAEQQLAQRKNAQLHEFTSACGRVTARVQHYKGGAIHAYVHFPFPELNARSALSLVYDLLPVRCSLSVVGTKQGLEEWAIWARSDRHDQGPPVLFAVLDKTNGAGGIPLAT
jgi:hypothetical protein